MLTNSIIDDGTGGLLEYRLLIKKDKHKKTWVIYFSYDLVVGDRVQRTNNKLSLAHDKISTDMIKDVIYGQSACNYRPQKDKTHWKRLVTGGNIISFPGNVSILPSETTTEKLFFNSIISTRGALFL